MDGERDPADSPRLSSLAEKFRDKRYRDGYIAAHSRGVLARQMRNFRGELSQAEFGALIDKRQTVVSRLESSAYGGWSLRTMLDIARKQNVAILVRFVDFPTFLKYSGDMSESALRPAPYEQEVIDEMSRMAECSARDGALKALFSAEPKQAESQSVRDALSTLRRPSMGASASIQLRAANDSVETLEYDLLRQQG
jgi:hypothetical protein